MNGLSNGFAILARMPTVDLFPMIVFPAFWVVMCLYFCAKSAVYGMPRTERIEKIPKSPYMPRIILEFGYWMFTLPIAICLKLGITPNMLTIGSFVVSIGAAISFMLGHFSFGGWVLFLAFTMDAWDGIIARKTNRSSVGGEFLDATIDRYNDLICFLGIMYYYRNDPIPLALGTAALIGSTLVSYTRAKGEAVGVDPNVGYMQRHERAVYLGISTVFAPLVAAFVEGEVARPRYHTVWIGLAIMALATNFTALWRAKFVLDGLEKQGKGPAREDEKSSERVAVEVTP